MVKKTKRRITNALIKSVLAVLGIVLLFPSHANAEYYSNIGRDKMEAIFSLEIGDIPNAWQWLKDKNTFVTVEDVNGEYTYWWNTPNIQQSLENSLYDMLKLSGYGSGVGVSPSDNEWIWKQPSEDNRHTALDNYGFNIPNPSYMGERPLITISVVDVLLPDNPVNAVKRVLDLFTGTVVDCPTDKDLNSLTYVAPRDYYESGVTFKEWVRTNWKTVCEEMDEGQILVSGLNETDGKDEEGMVWVKKNIISDEMRINAKEKGAADKILRMLEKVCGDNYQEVCRNIIICSGLKDSHLNTRIMPYDLDRMNADDRDMFDGVYDPRCEMQKNAMDTGLMNRLGTFFSSFALNISGKLSEMAVALNQISTFEWIEGLGIDPTKFWGGGILKLVIMGMCMTFICYCVKTAWAVVTGGRSYMILLSKVVCTFLVALTVYAVTTSPGDLYQSIKDVSTTLLQMGNSVEWVVPDSVKTLYGDGDAQAKSDVNLWLPYFDMWTMYHTNHSLLDGEQTIRLEDGSPEVDHPDDWMVKIGDVDSKIWSTVLADAFTKPENYEHSVYRCVDHFMAPRITETNIDTEEDKVTISVERNENYDGDIQKQCNFSSILSQVLILVVTLMKTLLFYEFILNLCLLFVNICLSVGESGRIIRTVKECCASMMNVVFAGIASSLIVWVCLVLDGIGLLLMTSFFIWLIHIWASRMMTSSSVWSPKILRPVRTAYNELKRISYMSGGE